jgi:hypothetical protein
MTYRVPMINETETKYLYVGHVLWTNADTLTPVCVQLMAFVFNITDLLFEKHSQILVSDS